MFGPRVKATWKQTPKVIIPAAKPEQEYHAQTDRALEESADVEALTADVLLASVRYAKFNKLQPKIKEGL